MSNRREFIMLVGGAAMYPLAARAQQPSMPIVGLVAPRSPEESDRLGAPFRKGLNETGTIEGQNVIVEYHWLEGQYETFTGADGRPRAPSSYRHRRDLSWSSTGS
jgi:putative ABC transport system substrate-binding protein